MERHTHLIIDIRSLLPKNPPTGIPEYVKQLLTAMFFHYRELLVKKRFVVTLFSSGREQPDLQFLASYKQGFTHRHVTLSNRLLNAAFFLAHLPPIEPLALTQEHRTCKDIIFFAPNINLFPLKKSTRLITTFHDLSYERYPELLTPKEWWWHIAINPKQIARRTDHLIAVSHSTKQDLETLYGIPQKNISVIYSGISRELRKTEHTPKDVAHKTIFYLGSLEGRKNIPLLTKAFTLLKKRLRDKNVRLVLAGPGNGAKPYARDASIVLLGKITAEKRQELYKRASLFVYPSLFEGFGFPPLEAMASGVPVVTTHSSSLPEAVGDAALLTHPRKAHELAQTMEILLTDKTLREHYIKKGLERSMLFSWEKTAKETLNILIH